MGLLLNDTREMVTKNKEALDGFFALVFMSKTCVQESQVSDSIWKVWSNKDLPLMEEDQAREHLSKLDIHKSMAPDGIHLRVLSDLADVTARPLNL